MQSNYEAVKQFTEETGNLCSPFPISLSKQEVRFLLKMVLSELVELAQTVYPSHSEAVKCVKDCIGVDPSKQPEYKEDIEIVADQADAMVDAWYYMLNASAKKGIDLSRVFDEVHKANMNKRDKSGVFLRREDGKILKPVGWKPADILGLFKK